MKKFVLGLVIGLVLGGVVFVYAAISKSVLVSGTTGIEVGTTSNPITIILR